MAGLREFHGIADEVEQHLAQPRRITTHPAGQCWIDYCGDVQLFLLGRDGTGGESGLDYCLQIEVHLFKLNPVGLQLGNIQDVVDDSEQELSRDLDARGKLQLAASRSVSSSRPFMPMMPFIGVRISWLIFAREFGFRTVRRVCRDQGGAQLQTSVDERACKCQRDDEDRHGGNRDGEEFGRDDLVGKRDG
ncbi:MAG: hypothetical protein WDN69_33425 [Aliidongia sp.]